MQHVTERITFGRKPRLLFGEKEVAWDFSSHHVGFSQPASFLKLFPHLKTRFGYVNPPICPRRIPPRWRHHYTDQLGR